MKGTLYLIPNLLGDSDYKSVIPEKVIDLLQDINYLIVENERTVRRYLVKLGLKERIDAIEFFVLNKHTHQNDLPGFLLPCHTGHNIGLISEAGCPGIADPGADIVNIAHQQDIRVSPISGPSSILLALISAGFNGQCFTFHGYLPIPTPDRAKKIKEMELNSRKDNQSQIFMETPFRNQKLLKTLMDICRPDTKLCIACDISLDNEFIKTKTIAQWKKNIPDIHKRPTVFVM